MTLFAEIALAGLSYVLSFCMFREQNGEQWTLQVLAQTLPLVIALRVVSLFSAGLFKRSFRYASIPDLVNIGKAVSFGSLLCFLFIRGLFPQLQLPLALFVVDWAVLQFLLGGLHFGARVYKTLRAIRRKEGKRVVIVGAGDAGVSVLKELSFDSSASCRPIAVVDDDPRKQGTTVCGVPVLGSILELAKVAQQKHAEEVLICVPSATRSQMSHILLACRQCRIPVRALPSLAELVDGTASWRDLRRVRIEDILQREEVHDNLAEIQEIVSGRIVLVTGAGGSIGSELCRQIASAVPSTLLLLEKSENSLFYILREIRERFPAVRVKPFLVDIAHEDLVREIFRNQRPNLIFHAAAYKHVGLLEIHPHEAIRNNVLGTRNVGLAALESAASRFVNISTDKAVNPSSYMGLSKKLTELCIQELARQKSTRFMNVRFGNVAGSTGSVLRLFWDQIQKGQPLQVTDPRATRYFMTIAEAVYLILRAATLGHGGETFIFDMGDPVNIYELAKTVSLFAGLMPEKELPIQFIGLNEGEKICEQLWEEWEHPIPTAYNRILAIADVDPLSFSVFETIQQLETYLVTDDRKGLLTYLHSLMPRFAASRQQCSPVNEETTWTPTVASREVV